VLVFAGFAFFALACSERRSALEAAGFSLEGYRRAELRARAWLDALEVDSVELTKHGVTGKKKLGEILGVYSVFYGYATGEDEHAIQKRARELARQTERSEYHNLQTCSDGEFRKNSMSYLRVMKLMQQFGFDISRYWSEVDAVKARLDGHLEQRGAWQRDMFARYYDHFGLAKPPLLDPGAQDGGILAERKPAARLDWRDTYRVTHAVFVAYDYGTRRSPDSLSDEDLEYLRELIPRLLADATASRDPDLGGELLLAATYLSFNKDPAYPAAAKQLLATQNSDGSWGDDERYRSRYGPYLDQRNYLHTTGVVLKALAEAFLREAHQRIPSASRIPRSVESSKRHSIQLGVMTSRQGEQSANWSDARSLEHPSEPLRGRQSGRQKFSSVSVRGAG
jgi:hypothetical protein